MVYGSYMAHVVSLFRHDRKSYQQLTRLSAVTFVFGLIYGLFSFYLPIFVESSVKNIAVVGMFLAVVEIMGMAVDLPLGAFADRVGRRKTIFLGALSLFFSALIFELSSGSLLLLATALVFYGVIVELVLIPQDAELMALNDNSAK